MDRRDEPELIVTVGDCDEGWRQYFYARPEF